MTDQELKDLVASLAVQSAKTDTQLAKIAQELKAFKIETNAQFAKTDATLEKLGVYDKSINQQTVGIVEVKSKVHRNDIAQLKKIVEQFYQFHPAFKLCKIIPALAGKVFSKQLQEQALNAGFIVFTQQGQPY